MIKRRGRIARMLIGRVGIGDVGRARELVEPSKFDDHRDDRGMAG